VDRTHLSRPGQVMPGQSPEYQYSPGKSVGTDVPRASCDTPDAPDPIATVTGCGPDANASCNCGKPYVPAAQRVADYDQANPGRSTRQAAAELGVDKETVRKARKSGGDRSPPVGQSGASTEAPAESSGDAGASPAERSGEDQSSPATVTGRDGKKYPGSKKEKAAVPKTKVEADIGDCQLTG
jgi:hypothetical protein